MEFNDDGMEELRRQLEKRFADGIQVPLEGSEDDALRSVKEQLEKLGATSDDDDELLRVIREARRSG